MLLDVDGLSVGWNNGVPLQWELEGGKFDERQHVPDSTSQLIYPNGVTTVCRYARSLFKYQEEGDMRDGDVNDKIVESKAQSTNFVGEGTAVNKIS